MRNFLSKLILRFIGKKNLSKFLGLDEISEKRNQNIDGTAELKLGKASRLYPTTNIFNFQKDRDRIRIGNGTHIRGELLVFKYGGQIQIGDNCFVGEGTRIWSGEQIKIGNNVLISHNVNIVDTNSHELDFRERRERYKELLITGHWKDKGSIMTDSVNIEDDVWISFSAIILKGVSIGKGSIVAAGSVVTKNIPEFVIVAGNPATIIKKLDRT